MRNAVSVTLYSHQMLMLTQATSLEWKKKDPLKGVK